MANKKITLKDQTNTDELYPATLISNVFDDNANSLDTILSDLDNDINNLNLTKQDNLTIKTKTVSGTTNNYGNIIINDLSNTNTIITSVIGTTGNYRGFVVASGNVYVIRVIDYSGTSNITVANTQVSFTVRYIEI